MAWKTQSNSNDALIDGLKREGIIQSQIVESIMRKVDRGNYSSSPKEAYNDNPHGIGHGQTISAPHMHAQCLELLKDYGTRQNARILDVGSGSGYLCACFGRMVEKTNGKVIGIDVVKPLVDWSVQNLQKADKDLLDTKVVEIKVGDGWSGDDNGPFGDML